jgi:hypothetical protein
MDARHGWRCFHAIRQWRIAWSLPQVNSDSKIRQDAGFWNAQGIGAVSFFAKGKKDTSVKPGPRAVLPAGQDGPRMRPK